MEDEESSHETCQDTSYATYEKLEGHVARSAAGKKCILKPVESLWR
jgi:hypothetical protein